MKSLFKIFFLFSVIFLFSNASVYKGQKEYMKNCKVCHGNGAKVAKAKTAEEWITLFANSGTLIKKLHEKDLKAMKYFNSERFSKKNKHLLDFFKKYASDSGNVPACSD